MVVKKYQKGGLQYKILSEYFENIYYLLKKLMTPSINFADIKDILDSFRDNNNILFRKIIDKLNKKLESNRNNENITSLKLPKLLGTFFVDIFTSVVNCIEEESFISKLLNIYIYMLFINYLITLDYTNKHNKHPYFSFLKGRIVDLINNKRRIYPNSKFPNYNQDKLNNMNKKVTEIKKKLDMNENHFTEELLGRIKKLFIEKYSSRVPILYGNDYVGNLSKQSKKYIINPVGAFILKLYKSDIHGYKRRLLHLLQSVIGSDKIPNLKYLDNGTEFCIIKEQNHEKICEQVRDCSGSRVSSFFRSSLYGNRMIAEITKENIASDEHILELLDILLNLFLQNNEILRTNINHNEVQQFNLSQRRSISLSNQRRLFAEGAQLKVPNNNEQSSNNFILP